MQKMDRVTELCEHLYYRACNLSLYRPFGVQILLTFSDHFLKSWDRAEPMRSTFRHFCHNRKIPCDFMAFFNVEYPMFV